jgi:hypothetical protein
MLSRGPRACLALCPGGTSPAYAKKSRPLEREDVNGVATLRERILDRGPESLIDVRNGGRQVGGVQSALVADNAPAVATLGDRRRTRDRGVGEAKSRRPALTGSELLSG